MNAKKKNIGRYTEKGSNEIEILLQTDHPKRNKKRNLSNLSSNTPAKYQRLYSLNLFSCHNFIVEDIIPYKCGGFFSD